jgi:hypothetical protein
MRGHSFFLFLIFLVRFLGGGSAQRPLPRFLFHVAEPWCLRQKGNGADVRIEIVPFSLLPGNRNERPVIGIPRKDVSCNGVLGWYDF